MSKRRIVGTVVQAMDEAIPYEIDWSKYVGKYGSPSAAGVCTLYDNTSEEDVSATKLSGSASLSGNVITTKLVSGLEEDHEYQLNQAADFAGGLTFSGYVIIRGER